MCRQCKQRFKTDYLESPYFREDEHEVFAIIMTQLSLKQGLKAFGNKGKKATLKEMTQLHDMSAFLPRGPKNHSLRRRG